MTKLRINPTKFKTMENNLTFYGSRNIRNYKISEEIYRYLLCVFGRCAIGKKNLYPMIEERQDKYFFYGTPYDFNDMQERTEIIREEIKEREIS